MLPAFLPVPQALVGPRTWEGTQERGSLNFLQPPSEIARTLLEGRGSGARRGRTRQRGLTPDEARPGPASFEQSNGPSAARMMMPCSGLLSVDDVPNTQTWPDFGPVEPWPDEGPPSSGSACTSGPPVPSTPISPPEVAAGAAARAHVVQPHNLSEAVEFL